MPRSAALVVALLSGCATTMYYPAPVPPPDGWEPVCDVVVATVTVENTLEVVAEVHELNPYDNCQPQLRGSVGPGEAAALGAASGATWRAYAADDGEWLGTFVLGEGENVLVLE